MSEGKIDTGAAGVMLKSKLRLNATPDRVDALEERMREYEEKIALMQASLLELLARIKRAEQYCAMLEGR